jgi:FtsP/CotA-like multicopper oxidase with cupredoxin domain
MLSKPILYALVVAGLGVTSRPATAAVYNLRAASTTVTMTDGTQVPMWGFGLTTDPAVSIPGPALDVPPGDTTLTINLTNELPVPVSIVIPGIPAPLTPVWNDGTTGPRTNLQQRAVSFTHVAQPGQTVVYQWTNIQAGTYLYHSGTHPAVQVAMGLYGAVRHDAVIRQAYGMAYDRDLTLVYSEIDPVQNNAVASGTFGTSSYPSTVNYHPRYFLINGRQTSSPVEQEVTVNERLLIRAVNAGLSTIVPTLSSGSMTLLAEDGQRAPFSRASYSMMLPAGKTIDALLVLPDTGGTMLFDRRSSSKLARITVAPSTEPPVAVADVYAATEDTTLSTAVAALPGVLGNDTGLGLTAVLNTPTSNGTLTLQPSGSFTYVPAPNYNGPDSFSYHASSGSLSSNVVAVTINVAAVNDPPVAVADAHQATVGTPLMVAAPGVLANDSDVDGDAISALLVVGPNGGTLSLSANGSFQYTASIGTTTDSFTYRATDGIALSNIVTVDFTVTPAANLAPLAVNDAAKTLRNTTTIIHVVGNDSDFDGYINPATVTLTQPKRGGIATNLGNGTVRFQPGHNFRGIDTFTYRVRDNRGAVSGLARVRVTVESP